MKIVQLSENTLVVLFEQLIDLNVSKKIFTITRLIEAELGSMIIDIIPSYASIHLLFDLRKISSMELRNEIERIAQTLFDQDAIEDVRNKEMDCENTIIEIPVYYGQEVGFDLDVIASTVGLTVDEVISIHSGQLYDVYAMGFSPGFAYLGSVDERIAISRKETPRLHIPAGSLGIANQQTAIYPSDSPGGWQIIGRTPTLLVDYNKKQPTVVKTGDSVRFLPIDKQEYIRLGGQL